MPCVQGHLIFPGLAGVLRIHLQLDTVMCVLKGISKGGQHLPAMGFDPGVAHDSRVRRQGAKIVKEPLGPWWTPRSLWGDHNHRAGGKDRSVRAQCDTSPPSPLSSYNSCLPLSLACSSHLKIPPPLSYSD
uniref:Uncharacterized protein n=1 Tax=Sus scrofa TaxID=9823 RepID=A0A8D0U2V2_PIG